VNLWIFSYRDVHDPGWFLALLLLYDVFQTTFYIPHYPSGKKEKKDKSYKVLIMLIAAMYINQSITISIDWYSSWLVYIKYGGSSDAVSVSYAMEYTPVTVLNLFAAKALLESIKVGIADSIMVYILILTVIIPDYWCRFGGVGLSATGAGKL
jgi:hypothetical protein